MSEEKNINYTIHSNATHSYWVKKFWKNFLFYSKSLKTNDPSELNTAIKKEISEFSLYISRLASIRSNYLRSAAQDHFSKNPQNLIKHYETILENSKQNPDYFKGFNPYTYSYNKDSFHTQFLVELLIEFRHMYPKLKPGSKEELKLIQLTLSKNNNYFDKKVKESYIQLLTKLGEFLKKFNLTEEYASTFKYMLGSYSLKELSYPAHDNEPNCKSIDNLFTEDYLSTLSLTKITALAGFWINKAAKTLITFNELLFIINDFHLWEDVKNQKKYLELDDKSFKSILEKTYCLSQFEESIFDTMEELQLEHPTLKQDEINLIFEKHFNRKVKIEGKKYQSRFSKSLPQSNNDLDFDLSSFHEMANTRYLLYRLKDICIFNLLMGSIDEHYCKNWGIIPSEDNNKFATIAFDVEGLNMPLRLHVYKSELLDFLKDYTEKPIIPLYKGSNDMIIDGQYISTTILMPFYKKQTTEINKKLANPQQLPLDVINFLKHIKFLKDNSKTPPSIKNESLTTPNALNLETNEFLHISKKEFTH